MHTGKQYFQCIRMGEMKDFFNNIIVLVNYIMRIKDILRRRMNIGALLTVLKEFVELKSF